MNHAGSLGFADRRHPLYFRPVSCNELTRLREQARTLTQELQEKTRRARSKSNEERGGQQPGVTDFEPYLKRKLMRASMAIESHIAQHGCSD